MTASLYLLLPISVLFVFVIGAALWWAIFSGQFDDADAAAKAVLLDDDDTSSSTGQDDSTHAAQAKDASGR